jgi:hypothetical protein
METARIDRVLIRQRKEQVQGLLVGASALLGLLALVASLVGGC